MAVRAIAVVCSVNPNINNLVVQVCCAFSGPELPNGETTGTTVNVEIDPAFTAVQIRDAVAAEVRNIANLTWGVTIGTNDMLLSSFQKV